jgi:hypothetical protein
LIPRALLREFLKNKIKFVIRDTLLKQALTPNGHGWIEFQKLDMKKKRNALLDKQTTSEKEKIICTSFFKESTHTSHAKINQFLLFRAFHRTTCPHNHSSNLIRRTGRKYDKVK